MDTIEVIVPKQSYDIHVYCDYENCYLATALKKMGYKNVKVGDDMVIVGDSIYIPSHSTPFNIDIASTVMPHQDVRVILEKD